MQYCQQVPSQSLERIDGTVQTDNIVCDSIRPVTLQIAHHHHEGKMGSIAAQHHQEIISDTKGPGRIGTAVTSTMAYSYLLVAQHIPDAITCQDHELIRGPKSQLTHIRIGSHCLFSCRQMTCLLVLHVTNSPGQIQATIHSSIDDVSASLIMTQHTHLDTPAKFRQLRTHQGS